MNSLNASLEPPSVNPTQMPVTLPGPITPSATPLFANYFAIGSIGTLALVAIAAKKFGRSRAKNTIDLADLKEI